MNSYKILRPSLLLLLLFIVGARPSHSHAATALSEYEIKAGWIITIIDYIKVPKNNINSICTIGYDGVVSAINELNSKNKKNLEILNKSPTQPFDECKLLYISMSEAENYKDVLKKLENSSVATISGINSFSTQGGIIEFIQKNKSIVLKINMKNAGDANVSIDSDLRRWSEVVY